MNIDIHIIITLLLIIASCLFISTRIEEHFYSSINCISSNKEYEPNMGWKNWWKKNQANNIEFNSELLDKNIPELLYDGIRKL